MHSVTDQGDDHLASIRALAPEALIDRYSSGVHLLDRRVLALDEAALDTCFREDAGVGRWSCRVLIGHLADAELLMTWRLRRVASEDGPLLAPWDHESPVDAGLYTGVPTGGDRQVAGSIAVIHTLRLWNADWLRSLDQDSWRRSGLHPQDGPQTLRTILDLATHHLEHHARFLRAKLERLAPVPST